MMKNLSLSFVVWKSSTLALLLSCLFQLAAWSQTATTIGVTGTNSALSASYNTATVVDPNLVITSDGTISGFKVQITQSYVSGATGDILDYTGTLPSGVTATAFNTTTGVLTFSGTTSAANWQTLLRTVRFKSTTSTCYPTMRTITFTAGNVFYNPLTGHYYEYVLSTGNWPTAKTNAELRSYFGRLGYLATMQSSAENNFVWKIMSNDAWFGCSDEYTTINAATGVNTFASQAAAEGRWYWVSGPEKGTLFSVGNSSPVTQSGQYANWNGGEPNNSGGEHSGQFYSGNSGRWNDLNQTTTLAGYLTEYGGMPGDLTTSTPIFTRSVTVAGAASGSITGGGGNVCSGSNSTTLTLTGLTGSVVRWESSLDNFFTAGTTINNTTLSLTVSNITQTTYYRAVVNSTSPASCSALATSSVSLTVAPTLSGSISAINNQICANGDVELTLSGNQGNINKWQRSTNQTTWTDIANTTNYLTEVIPSAGTYYYRAEVQTPGCGAAVYTANKTITVIAGTPPDGGSVSSAGFCGGTNSGTLTLSAYTGTITKWQRSVDNGIVWTDIANTAATYSFSGISATTLYRAVLTNGSCGTAYSTSGSVTVSTNSVAGTATGNQTVCGGSGITNITLSGNTGTIQWASSLNNSTFTNITGATSSTLAQSNLSSNITQTTYYRATVTNGACASVNSNTITATYNAPVTYYQDSDADGYGKDNVTQSVCTGQPTGYTTQGGDCNDLNASVKPSATETCNLIDDNCNGSVDEGVQTTFYVDFDGDGYGNPAVPVLACTQPTGYVNNSNDFNDNNNTAYNGAPELCDGIDNDGDALIDEGVQNTYYADSDGDSYGDLNVPGLACSQPLNYVSNSTDCNDLNAAINTAATEICNGVDDDCDGLTDEGVQTTYYADADGDGFGNSNINQMACSQPLGYVLNQSDCNDSNGSVNTAATEICNSIDDDCDGLIDEGVQNTYFLDADGDGYGTNSTTTLACSVPVNYVTNDNDCDDASSTSNPGGTEICNGADDDCDGSVDEGVQTTFYADVDSDGYGDIATTTLACVAPAGYVSNDDDCNDASAGVNPGASEICNGVDEDCDGEVDEFVKTTFYVDMDGDGFGNLNVSVEACTAPTNYVLDNTDCDDANITYADNDNDGYGSTLVVACGVLNNTDCNDNDAALNTISTEVCNNFDDDCDGTADDGLTFINYYADADGDGYGTGAASNLCSNPGAGYVTNNTDCNDNDAALNTISTEVCNNFDDDCDGTADDGLTFINYYADADGDGYGTGAAGNLCSNPGAGYVTNNTDCNDNDATLNSISTEVCNNFDDDCDGTADDGLTFINYYADADGDGYGTGAAGNLCSNPGAGYVTNNTDCNDNDATLNSISTEVCNNFDDDCDGTADNGLTFVNYYADADGDGYGAGAASNLCADPGAGYVTNNTDCNGNDAALNSISTEVCNNFDDDCDGSVDNGLTFINYYVDADGDGYGAGAASNLCADPGAGYVTNNTDCNDNDAALNTISTEVCNNFDDDCDGSVDNGLTFINYYVDGDGDGYGAGAASNLCADPGAGYVTNNTDCNDNDAALNSISTEVCNNFDDDCDGEVDEFVTTTFYADLDEDGFGDLNLTVEACSSPINYVLDNSDCDDANVTYDDNDNDGYGSTVVVACGVLNNTDCNDNDATLNSISTEVCNNFDDDCDGTADNGLTFINYYVDADGDGYGAGAASNLCADPGAGYVTNNTDCNDNDATLNSISTEVCNNFDDDCDGTADDGLTFINYYTDADGDGYGVGAASNLCADPGAGYVTNNTDCNDNDAALNSISTEVCNNFDDDCDGSVDNGLTFINYYVDADGDGYGAGAASNLCADPGAGYVTNNTDCNDNDAALNSISTEVCNNFDDDCDGAVDNGLTFINYYVDADGDGYGAGAASNLCADPGAGYVTNNTDCNDNDAALNTISTEVCNNFDDDCDGSVDNGLTFINYYVDADGDGYGTGAASNLCADPGAGYVTNNTDCNDNDATLNSISTEVCNNFDDNCDGEVDEFVTTTFYADLDGDGFGDLNLTVEACSSPIDYVLDNSDCDDANVTYEDNDNDGYGSTVVVACGVLNNTDCNDNDATLNSISTEVCNNYDDDCDGTTDNGLTFVNYYADADGDGYGAGAASNLCSNPGAGYVTNNTDCNDNDATLNSISTEVCNNFDDDCDGSADNGLNFVDYFVDADGDGFGVGVAINLCSDPGAGYTINNGDCDDAIASAYPGASEQCNTIDDDCNGVVDNDIVFVFYYMDTDGDGYGAAYVDSSCVDLGTGYATNDLDCDDSDVSVNPAAQEICNTYDDDCDGEADEFVTTTFYADLDGDGFGDLNAAVESCTTPINYVSDSSDCDDASLTYEDNDGDGYGSATAVACGVYNNEDCNDNDSALNSISTEVCNNFDDDCDGVADNGLTFVDYFIDADGDGYGAGAASNLCTDPGAGYVMNNTDCNDSDATLNSISIEVCNNFDDDCDGSVDNGVIFIDYFVDEDGDGFGAGAANNWCTDPGSGYVMNNSDCNDADAALNSVTEEVCNNFDDDCDGEVDEFVTSTFYADLDGDLFGDANNTVESCDLPSGYVNNADDCDDTLITYEDLDADGVGSTIMAACGIVISGDCDDLNSSVYPSASEVCGNGIDEDCDGNDLICQIAGCTDVAACNYDATANTDDGSCFYPAQIYLNCDGSCINDADGDGVCDEIEIAGCTDALACNYDATATDDNGSCTYPAQVYLSCDGTCINDTDGDGVCDEIEIAGCTDATACNYDASATDENGSCTYPTLPYLNCDGTCINDTDGDGVCNELEIVGCTDVTACNFEATATDDNGSCTYPAQAYLNCDGTCINDIDSDGVCDEIEIAGCTDVTACNFDATATDDNGSCTYQAQPYLNCDGSCINDTDGDGVCDEIEIAGCTDATACNYDATATDENGLCTYPTLPYLNCDGICINDTDGDGVCNELEIAGCTDVTACNFDATATDDNGSCTYPAQPYLNCDGTCINDTDGDGVCNELEIAGCTDVTACNFDATATDENGSCTYPAQTYLNCDGTCINDTDGDGVCNELEIAGCTDATACNYDATATDENGSCTYPAQTYLNCDGTCINDTDGDGVCNENEIAGCTNSSACNYNPSATDDNGSCVLPVAEICNQLDDDCDGEVDEFVTTTYYADLDGDGFGDANNTAQACTIPAGYVNNSIDCDDAAITYLDADNDGFGSTNIVECGVYNNTDCNDGTPLVQPNATEICNEVDDDCDGAIDEGVQNIYYADVDGDGFGDGNASVLACTIPQGFVLNATDCDDTQWTYLDVDQDGYGVGNPIECGASNNLDCNDINSSMNPGVPEVCNGIDDNCSGVIDEGLLTTYYIDVDEDSYGDPNNMIDACTQPAGFVTNNDDCNDAANWANPAGIEVCNGVDDNCDGVIDEGVQLTYYGDLDGDGYGNINDSIWSCAQPDGYIDNTLDCNDAQPSVFTGATEVYDGLDNDCDELVDEGFEFIPDAFSPNGDGDYDNFVIDRLLPQEHVSMKVFNRWGGLMYESSDYKNDWNGKSNVGGNAGEEMAVGTYFYEIELQFSKKTYSGYITLWR